MIWGGSFVDPHGVIAVTNNADLRRKPDRENCRTLRVMNLLETEPLALKRLAADCESWSAEVAVTGAPAIITRSAQATASAVTAIHTQLYSTGNILSARMRRTATALTDAACGYTAQDDDCATTLDGLSIGS